MAVQWLPMQQPPTFLDGAKAGSEIGSNMVDSFLRVMAAKNQNAAAQQELKHKAIMGAYAENQGAIDQANYPDVAKTNLDYAKALAQQMTDNHFYQQLSIPHINAHLDAQTADLNSQADQREANTQALKDAAAGIGKKGGLYSRYSSYLNPSDPNDRSILTSLAMMDAETPQARLARHFQDPNAAQSDAMLINAAEMARGRSFQSQPQLGGQILNGAGPALGSVGSILASLNPFNPEHRKLGANLIVASQQAQNPAAPPTISSASQADNSLGQGITHLMKQGMLRQAAQQTGPQGMMSNLFPTNTPGPNGGIQMAPPNSPGLGYGNLPAAPAPSMQPQAPVQPQDSGMGYTVTSGTISRPRVAAGSPTVTQGTISTPYGAPPPAQQNPAAAGYPTILNAADYSQLPPGSVYMGSDGRLHKKTGQ